MVARNGKRSIVTILYGHAMAYKITVLKTLKGQAKFTLLRGHRASLDRYSFLIKKFGLYL